MEEKENYNLYAIPTNYTDSGKLLGGLVSVRNAIETVILVAILGFLEYILIPAGTVRIVIMTTTLTTFAVFSAVGVDGDSLGQYIGHIFKFLFRRKKLHYKRVDIDYEE